MSREADIHPESQPDVEAGADYVLTRDDLRDFHYQWGSDLSKNGRHGEHWSDSGAWTHCICFGAAARATAPLLERVAELQEALERWMKPHPEGFTSGMHGRTSVPTDWFDANVAATESALYHAVTEETT